MLGVFSLAIAIAWTTWSRITFLSQYCVHNNLNQLFVFSLAIAIVVVLPAGGVTLLALLGGTLLWADQRRPAAAGKHVTSSDSALADSRIAKPQVAVAGKAAGTCVGHMWAVTLLVRVVALVQV